MYSGIDERTNVKERLDTLLDNTAEDNINKLKTESKFEIQSNQYKELNENENVKKNDENRKGLIKHEKEKIKKTNDIKDEKNNDIKKKIFDIHKIDNDETSTSTEEKVLKKKRGRPRNNNSKKKIKEHTKEDNDNILKKFRTIIIYGITEFLNEKIKEDFPKDKILKIPYKLISDTTIKGDIEFINKTLKDIFSSEISEKYKTKDRNYNKILIQKMYEKEKYKKLLDKTIKECIKQIKNEDDEILKGLKGKFNVKIYLKKEKPNNSYVVKVDKMFRNYEEIIYKRIENYKIKTKE